MLIGYCFVMWASLEDVFFWNVRIMNAAKPFGVLDWRSIHTTAAITLRCFAFMTNAFHGTPSAIPISRVVRQSRRGCLRHNNSLGFRFHLFAEVPIQLDNFNMKRIVVFVDVEIS